MKNAIQYILQRLLGFESYLFWFCRFKVATLPSDPHERHIFRVSELHTAPGSVILDIGANIGIITVHLARMFPGHTIFAFEPVPENYRVLCRIVAHYKLKNVKTFNLGLSDFNGEFQMLMPEQGKVRKQGLSHVLSDESDHSKGTRYNLPARRLDDWWKEHAAGLSVGGMKLDVENHEAAVLRGAITCLTGHRPWIVTELWDNDNRRETYAVIQSLGKYSCKVNRNKRLLDGNINDNNEQNFFFIP